MSLMESTGHSLTIDDFDLIAKLDAVADEVVHGIQVGDSSIYSFPVIVGGYAFFAPTIGKEIFWRECVKDAVCDELKMAAYLWLLQLGEIPKERGEKIEKAVKKWARQCSLNSKDVANVLDKYSVGEAAGPKGANYGDVIALLVREYGHDCEHWLNAPEHEIKMMLGDWNNTQEAKASAMRSSKSKGGAPIPPAPSPKIKAVSRFNVIKREIEESWLSA